jgi:hypothetical protein
MGIHHLVPAVLTIYSLPGSGDGLSSPSPLEYSPRSQPPSPGLIASPAPPDLDPEAVRDALRDFLQELRSAQRERVRLVKMAGWGDQGLGKEPCWSEQRSSSCLSVGDTG